MTDTLETLRRRLRDRIADRHTTARALSLAIGANHAYVAQILDGRGGMPAADRLGALAAELGTTPAWLLGEGESEGVDGPPLDSEVSVRDRPNAAVGDRSLPAIPLVGTGDCAELTIEDAQTGETITVERSSFDPDFHVRYIRRPAALAQARDIYAIYFHGSSMEPRFFAGEIGLVDPRRPAGPGDYVLVQLTDGESDEVTSVLVKRLVRQTAEAFVLEQHNPVRSFAIPRTRVARVHRVLGPSELLG